jgi:hypothetical protein
MEAELCSETLISSYEITSHHILDENYRVLISRKLPTNSTSQTKFWSHTLVFVNRVTDIYIYIKLLIPFLL